jgi:addiction module HigA family antidote
MPQGLNAMAPVVHPGRLLKREMVARKLSANRLSLDIGVPSGRVTDILNGCRAITADTAVRLGRYFGNSAQFWLDLQGQYDIGVVEREKGAEISRRVRPATRHKRDDVAPCSRGVGIRPKKPASLSGVFLLRSAT